MGPRVTIRLGTIETINGWPAARIPRHLENWNIKKWDENE